MGDGAVKSVEVIRESDSRLKRDVWNFFYLDGAHALKLYKMKQQARPTTRHKFQTHNHWSRYDQRRNTIDTVPLPEDVQREAIEQFMMGLVVDWL